jgi:hypothetical protein
VIIFVGMAFLVSVVENDGRPYGYCTAFEAIDAAIAIADVGSPDIVMLPVGSSSGRRVDGAGWQHYQLTQQRDDYSFFSAVAIA